MRALVVDNDQDFRVSLANTLVSLGMSVREAETAEQAQAYFHNESGAFDVLFTDLRMPGIDGIALMQYLRKITPDLSIVVVTAYADMEVALQAIQLQATGFLRKPFTLGQLEETLFHCREGRVSRSAPTSPPHHGWHEQLVRVLTLSVGCWVLATGKNKAELSSESGLWSVHLDKSSSRTRTLDKYLQLNTMPFHPHWEVVLHTARFVLDRTSPTSLGLELEGELHKLETMLHHLGKS